MNLKTLIFITKRLLISKRNKGIVHIISLISLIGVAVGSFALVVVLSVFNGFTDVAQTMLGKTCPPLLIKSSKGSVLDSVPSIAYPCANVVKTTAMISIGNNRCIVTLMGIDSNYFRFNNLDSCIVNGKAVFDVGDSLFCLMGINQSAMLGLNRGAEKMNIPVKLTVPAANGEDAMVIEDKLTSINVFYQASFQTHSDLDDGIVFIAIDKARQLLSMKENSCNSVYVLPQNKSDVSKIKTNLQQQLGDNYTVETILEQEPVYFRIVKSEKLAVYIILAFIIFIASINIISAIIILRIQKEKMNKILRTIGMRLNDLRKVYFTYGMAVNIAGCLVGVVSGLVLCLLQQHFGAIKLAKDAFVVDAFPVKIFLTDIINVFVLVVLIGTLCIGAITKKWNI